MDTMKLVQYLAETAVTQKEFADKIGEKLSCINKYCLESRIPRPATMLKIFNATNGAVTPNDFYNVCGDDANVPADLDGGGYV